MKHLGSIGKITALALVAMLTLTGCGGQVAAPSGSTVSSTATLNTNDSISHEQAVEITKDVYKRTNNIYYFVLSYPSLLKADSNQTIPDNSYFWLVTDERFQTMAELRAYVETAYTSNYVDKYLANRFNEESGFREYNGRLYADCRLGGIGNLRDYALDTLRILSQDKDTLTVECDVYHHFSENSEDRLVGIQTYVMKKTDGLWRLDDESYVEQ